MIGADLAAPGLRDDPTLPLMLARWVRAIGPIPSPEGHHATAPEASPQGWRWLTAAAIALLWLPLPRPRHRPWHLTATLSLAAALVAPYPTGHP